MKNLIEKEVFGIFAMVILLIPQIAHTLYVFEANSHYDHPWFSWCYALGVDLAILIFTVKGWLRTAFIYLFVTLAHNLVYQFMPEGDVSSILISVVQSTTLFSFCHLFFKNSKEDQTSKKTDAPLSDEALEIQHAIEAGVHFKPHPYICPECNMSFPNSEQLEVHILEHKTQKDWKPERYGAWELENDTRYNYCSNFRVN
ncbi:C2H2-type zinc finger protein [Aquimarina sp. TRL1]|uniref:C2H2-type zinc finger protein n=1 Tax=Aquimarina sp. (strain TRL1) TaxID=2736252 RepID=UPI00158C81CA|nr:C2H2-type zinc finger protein [Aquimarina sp. TRL1]QKX04182.1 C2H2-type zinc finger protein [Aquimarina sp. TRL1]